MLTNHDGRGKGRGRADKKTNNPYNTLVGTAVNSHTKLAHLSFVGWNTIHTACAIANAQLQYANSLKTEDMEET
jgi:hypothetical protein